MELLDIRDIRTGGAPVYYRMAYDGNAIFLIQGKESSVPVSFVVETSPLGEKKISVKLLGVLDYPLLKPLRLLKERVTQMHKDGLLTLG